MSVTNPTSGPPTTKSTSVDQNDFRHAWVTVIANPWVLLGLTVVFGVTWFFGFQASVNTSGTLYMGIAFGRSLALGQITLLSSYWIPDQIGQLATGANSSEQQMALIVALFLEVITSLYSLGATYILAIVQRSHKGAPMTAGTARVAMLRHRATFILSLLIIGGNFAMNAVYGPGSIAGHAIFGLVVSIVTFTFLPLTVLTARACYHQFHA